jgi:hypothetical protein
MSKAKSKSDFAVEIQAKCEDIERQVAAMPKEEQQRLATTMVALVKSMKSGSFHCICGYVTPRIKGRCCKCRRRMGAETTMDATPQRKPQTRRAG